MDDYSHHENIESLRSAAVASSGQKRKSQDGGGQGTRSKRNRYISIACNECKRRKIKCNGQNPCQRCTNLQLECLYAPNSYTGNFKDTEEYKQMIAHIYSLQVQVDALHANVSAWWNASSSNSTLENGSHMPRLSPSRSISYTTGSQVQHRSNQQQEQPQFPAPSVAAYKNDTSGPVLRDMRILEPEEHVEKPEVALEQLKTIESSALRPDKDPLWRIDRTEAFRLLSVYEEEIGMTDPLLDIQKVKEHAKMLFTFVEAAIKTQLFRGDLFGSDALEGDDINILKMVLAIALNIEGKGKSELGRDFFESVRPAVERSIWGAEIEFSGVTVIALVALYQFHCNQEKEAWRYLGLVARLCIELGFHRHDALLKNFSDELERERVIAFFWSIFVLDRQWSLSLGMPFALHETDFDTNLPEPSNSPYLKCMVKFCQIICNTWKTEPHIEPLDSLVKLKDVEYQDFRIIQWQKAIPESLQDSNRDTDVENPSPNRSIRRLRSLLYMRANTARLIVYRQVLLANASISRNKEHGEIAVGIAKDTIKFLTRLDNFNDSFYTQHGCFNLIVALSTFLLAIHHAPTIFHETCRESFYLGIELLESIPTTASITIRLWRVVKGLENAALKTNLFPRLNTSDQAHETAAVAMATLANQPIDIDLLGGNAAHQGLYSHVDLIHEMTKFYEMIGEMMPAMVDIQTLLDDTQDRREAFSLGVDDRDELNCMIKDLFRTH